MTNQSRNIMNNNRAGLLTKTNASGFLASNGLLLALILMSIIFAVTSDNFLNANNFRNIFLQVSILSLIAVPMTMVVILGEIDLSIGAVVGLSGAVVGFLVVKLGIGLWAAIPLTLLTGAIVGLINGFISTKLRIPTFIVTLAMMTSLGGIALQITKGYPIIGFPESFSFWGQGAVAGIPVPVIFMAVFYIVGYIVMTQTTFGRQIYAIGGNAEAARLSGIKVAQVKIIVMSLTSAVSACSGVLLASRLTSGIANAGDTYMLDVLAAVIIGGTSLFGGEGKITGTFLGVLFMGILANGLVLIGVSPFMHLIIQGLVVLAAVILNTFKSNSRIGG